MLEEDPDLARGLDAGTRRRAERRSRARVVDVEVGSWLPGGDSPQEHGLLGLLLLDGLVVRRVSLGDRHVIDLLGRGDLVRPFDGELDEFVMLPSFVSWQVCSPLRLAVLDERFYDAMGGYPEVMSGLLGRVMRRCTEQAQRLAAVQQPRVSARLHFVLGQLAERFGRVERDGVVLSLPLSHGLLAELVSAQRQTVTGALAELEHAGLLARRVGGGFTIPRPRGDPPPRS